VIHVDAAQAAPPKPAFGRWLLNQRSAITVAADVRHLAEQVAQDRGYPRDGSPEDVSRHLNKAMADQETHEALESAIDAWRWE